MFNQGKKYRGVCCLQDRLKLDHLESLTCIIKELEMEIHPWEGVVKEEVSKHQETLSPVGLLGVLETQRAP